MSGQRSPGGNDVLATRTTATAAEPPDPVDPVEAGRAAAAERRFERQLQGAAAASVARQTVDEAEEAIN